MKLEKEKTRKLQEVLDVSEGQKEKLEESLGKTVTALSGLRNESYRVPKLTSSEKVFDKRQEAWYSVVRTQLLWLSVIALPAYFLYFLYVPLLLLVLHWYFYCYDDY